MAPDFATVYSSDDGMSVRLEAGEMRTARGREYVHHRLVVADGRPGAVVLALRGDSVLLVRSTREAAGAALWELPRGAGEPEESASDTAIRELREETGLVGGSARVIGNYITDSSVFPQPVAVVSCVVDENCGKSEPDGEISAERWVPVSELPVLVRNGTLVDAHSLAAIAIYSMSEEN